MGQTISFDEYRERAASWTLGVRVNLGIVEDKLAGIGALTPEERAEILNYVEHAQSQLSMVATNVRLAGPARVYDVDATA
jgi:hypothetical protein